MIYQVSFLRFQNPKRFYKIEVKFRINVSKKTKQLPQSVHLDLGPRQGQIQMHSEVMKKTKLLKYNKQMFSVILILQRLNFLTKNVKLKKCVIEFLKISANLIKFEVGYIVLNRILLLILLSHQILSRLQTTLSQIRSCVVSQKSTKETKEKYLEEHKVQFSS